MMDCGRIAIASIPVRKVPSDTSEMVNQLLFGEEYEVLREDGKWLHVRSIYDDYEGWIDRKQHMPTSTDKEESEGQLCSGIVELRSVDSSNRHRLTPGSLIHGVCHRQVGIGTEVFDIEGKLGLIERKDLVETSHLFLNTPYLWGGRSIWGIDCSGFTQVLFRLIGISLKRDASQQVFQGVDAPIGDASEGDLAFFKNNEGRITHVGVLISQNEIIHASGKVRIDRLDERGILIEETQEYSHSLHSIRRI